MDDIIIGFEKIIGNVPARSSRGCSDEEKERYYNLLEAAEDDFIEVVEKVIKEGRWQEPGLLDAICSLAIKEDGAYVDGEDREWSGYQDRLPFRLYESLEYWTVPVPKMLIEEIKKHLLVRKPEPEDAVQLYKNQYQRKNS